MTCLERLVDDVQRSLTIALTCLDTSSRFAMLLISLSAMLVLPGPLSFFVKAPSSYSIIGT